MPKREDLETIMIIGSGPIVIGQACEFDYAGTQACKALKEEGVRVVLVNSNPATIMTDPEMADRTYIEPLTPEICEKIIERERPDGLLPTLGGQTGLNIAVVLDERGVLEEFGVELIGANREAIRKAEDRELFKQSMMRIGQEVPKSGCAHTLAEAHAIAREMEMPLIIRPSFALGGKGSGICEDRTKFEAVASRALQSSPTSRILIEEFLKGWQEFELEVMRDRIDNVIIICSIENIDPMGIHTGDSITVAPQQTLSDKEYQEMRDSAIEVIREIGVDTGGSNIQFAVHPETRQRLVIEMNPRVSRSSALASKATGFPIAKIAAKLAIGYTLDEIPNDITRKTPASFEPTLDYCVVKIPRWPFDKFPKAEFQLTSQMKSVGEVMAIGRTFKEALQKGFRSLEIENGQLKIEKMKSIQERLRTPNSERMHWIREAFSQGIEIQEVHALTQIHPWFLRQIQEIASLKEALKKDRTLLQEAKRWGFSDQEISQILKTEEGKIRDRRVKESILPTIKAVDTCAAEFEAFTPYYYTTYESEDEFQPSPGKSVVILGSGPNRIGQGLEFDYCCVHASLALQEEGYETVMINSNPETVSTDYDISTRLYFDPITYEDVLNILEKEKPEGVILQFGGETPLRLALPLKRAGIRILGTPPEEIHRAEDRKAFKELIKELRLNQPESDTSLSIGETIQAAKRIGFPLILRPSYVLGGQAMEIVYDQYQLEEYVTNALQAYPGSPILIEKFLEDAIEIDIDGVSDGETVLIGAVMEHIEEAGIHSGDSTCVIPSYSLSESLKEEIRKITHSLAKALHIQGLFNLQVAVKNEIVYILEVNPRASRTIPFVSKTIGIPLAKIAAKVMVGRKLRDLISLSDPIWTGDERRGYVTVKKPVFPFNRLPGVDSVLGPEMRSTGEVMGIDLTYGLAFAKAHLATEEPLPLSGTVFISVNDQDKRSILSIAKRMESTGFQISATRGTARILLMNGITVQSVPKVGESASGGANVVDLIREGKIQIIINTPLGRRSRVDDSVIRKAALQYRIPCITTISGATALVHAIESLRKESDSRVPPEANQVRSSGPASGHIQPLQDYLAFSLTKRAKNG
ncbi:carbamoyl-phosphate synthase large subunit [candidate division TA06 bacterium]|nr:carbamoyl-phosphate synthase large subunit [candidate division TA06 bacterium]